MSTDRDIRLRDGRRLVATEWGASHGPVVILQHGTPSSRRELVFDEAAASARGMRFVSVDRPGYGESTFDPKRTLASWALDVGELADSLGLERFSVLGHSGGGPNALACAAHIGSRVETVLLVAAPAPRAQPVAPNRLRSLRARARAEMEVALARHFPERSLKVARRRLPPPDVATISREPNRTAHLAQLRAAPRTTARSIVLDRRLGRGDWGFELRQVRQRVHLFHGTEDRSVPLASLRRLAELLPDPVTHVLEGEGHLVVVDRFFELMDLAALDGQRGTAQPPSA